MKKKPEITEIATGEHPDLLAEGLVEWHANAEKWFTVEGDTLPDGSPIAAGQVLYSFGTVLSDPATAKADESFKQKRAKQVKAGPESAKKRIEKAEHDVVVNYMVKLYRDGTPWNKLSRLAAEKFNCKLRTVARIRKKNEQQIRHSIIEFKL